VAGLKSGDYERELKDTPGKIRTLKTLRKAQGKPQGAAPKEEVASG
jgi:hypothetical protein